MGDGLEIDLSAVEDVRVRVALRDVARELAPWPESREAADEAVAHADAMLCLPLSVALLSCHRDVLAGLDPGNAQVGRSAAVLRKAYSAPRPS